MGRVLFIADSLSDLNPKSDSSLALLGRFFSEGWTVFWTVPSSLIWNNGGVKAEALEILKAEKNAIPIGTPVSLDLSEVSLFLVRKDPPFDSAYVQLCWKLLPLEKKIAMVNPPSVLLAFHEKFIPTQALHQGFLKSEEVTSTYWGNREQLGTFLEQQSENDFILKPVLGHGGREILKISRSELEKKSDFGSQLIVQPFLTQIHEVGDRRVLFLGGEVIGSFVRYPKAGSFVANLAQGGSAKAEPLTMKQQEICRRLGEFLKRNQIYFAGADLIGNLVSEVNITSPTGLRTLEELDGDDRTFPIFQYLANLSSKAAEPDFGSLPEFQK